MERRQLSETYTGATASDYEDKRSQSGKWQAENDAVRGLLASLPPHSRIVDVPVGTGRFLEMYREAGLAATGVDVSQDMLREAAAKEPPSGSAATLLAASIFALPFPDAHFDAALCVRLLNWLDVPDLRLALAELARVSRTHVIAGIRSNARKPGLLETLFRRRSVAVSGGKRTSKTIVHDKADIADAFRAAGLTIVRQTTVPFGQPGTDYVIHLLKKTP